MTAQRQARQTRAARPAASRSAKAAKRTSDFADGNRVSDDAETLTDRAYRLIEDSPETLGVLLNWQK